MKTKFSEKIWLSESAVGSAVLEVARIMVRHTTTLTMRANIGTVGAFTRTTTYKRFYLSLQLRRVVAALWRLDMPSFACWWRQSNQQSTRANSTHAPESHEGTLILLPKPWSRQESCRDQGNFTKIFHRIYCLIGSLPRIFPIYPISTALMEKLRSFEAW